MNSVHFIAWSQDSSDSVVTNLLAGQLSLIPTMGRDFFSSLLHSYQL
jgi:hypothetical protein